MKPGSSPIAPRVGAQRYRRGNLGWKADAFWYGGSREGASDVALYTSVYSLQEKNWSPERVVVTREFAQKALQRYVRKLGNPVAGRDSKGRLCLYFRQRVGRRWAGSAVNLMVSEDEGEPGVRPGAWLHRRFSISARS